jgi:hypothetical protein
MKFKASPGKKFVSPISINKLGMLVLTVISARRQHK